jgi:hypothetical protein
MDKYFLISNFKFKGNQIIINPKMSYKMQKTGYGFLLTWILVATFTLTSCVKTGSTLNSGGNNSNSNNSIAYSLAYVAPKDGMISVSSERLIMHVGNNANLSARLYNGDGSLASPQPFLAWNSSVPTSVSVSSGTINAINIGDALITIGDGVHANGYVNVSVISDSIPIPSGPVNISFNVASLSLNNNSNITIPTYTLTDYQGNQIGGSVSFEIPDNSNVTVNSNTIKTNDSSGIGLLVAKYNGIYLNGRLPVFIHNTGSDTLRHIDISGNFPSVFNYYNEKANPLTIDVYESWGNGFKPFFKVYQTSPYNIAIDNPAVISVTNDGLLFSNHPGITPITINYKGAIIKQYCGVNVDMSGNWVGSKNNVNYNFSFGKRWAPISYNLFSGVSGKSDGTAIKEWFDFTTLNGYSGGAYISSLSNPNQTCFLYAGSVVGYNAGVFSGSFETPGVLFGSINLNSVSLNHSYQLFWLNKLDTIKADDIFLIRSNGSNSISDTNSLSLFQVLTNGSSKTWVGNDCYNNSSSSTFISAKFSNDGTGVSIDSASGVVKFNWTIDGNNSFTAYDPTGQGHYLTYYISNFTSNIITFSKIHEHLPNGTPVDSDAYFGDSGCVLGFQAQ